MSLQVLIVEDEPLIAMHLRTILEDAGHQVAGTSTTMNGALSLAAKNPHLDLAIIDIVLANVSDGVATARRLREEHDVASLFVSANLTDRTVAMAAAWRPVGFIGKPFQEEAILAALDALDPRPLTV